MRSRERVLRIVTMILNRPYHYTPRDLAEQFGKSKNTIDEDIIEIKRADIHLEQEKSHHRLAIIPDKSFNELNYLMPLSDEEQARIKLAIDRNTGSPKKAEYLKRKISSLYDFQRLGIRALRRPELEKLDLLTMGKENKMRIILEHYRSNSNEIKDRVVEPHHIDSEQGMLQAFDVDEQANRHFKLSRIKRVLETNISWMFEERHSYKYTDVFRIADSNPVSVHLELDVYAYNDLLESYPKAKSETIPASKKNTFDLQTKVNHKFLGLTNYILGNRNHVTILGPEELKQHILKEAQKIINLLKEQD